MRPADYERKRKTMGGVGREDIGSAAGSCPPTYWCLPGLGHYVLVGYSMSGKVAQIVANARRGHASGPR
jgi:hypothetical protein